MSSIPIVYIVGPTASGKSALAMRLAARYNGEIICADSRTVYKELDVGTAKPTREERARIRHWCLDMVSPDQLYTVANFQRDAREAIADITRRNKVPFIVGGTGLYIDALLFNYQLDKARDDDLRQELEKLNKNQLIERCIKNNIKLPDDIQNRRRLIRAIERQNSDNRRDKYPQESSIVVGITAEKQELIRRIGNRFDLMIQNNVAKEATRIIEKYGQKHESISASIYKYAYAYQLGEITRDELKDKITTRDWQLAKRQMTWFKRNEYIKWLSLLEAEQYVSDKIADYQNS